MKFYKVVCLIVLISMGLLSAQSKDMFKNLTPSQIADYKRLAKDDPATANMMLESNSDFQSLSSSEREKILSQVPNSAESQIDNKIDNKIEKVITSDDSGELEKDTSEVSNQKNELESLKENDESYRKIYGRHLFENKNGLDVNETQKTPADYIIREGDRVQLRFWGQVNLEKNILVGKDGYVFIEPFNRQEYVKGMSYAGLRSMINRTLEGMVGVEGDVMVIPTNVTRVRITGSARRPGALTIPSSFTFWELLMMSGGPDDVGSVRDIRLIRQGNVIYKIDLYEYLLKGKYKEITLRDGDEIQFTNIGKVVEIKNIVRRIGLYELSDREGLGQLVEYAGGLEAKDVSHLIRIERIVDPEKRTKEQMTRTIVEVPFANKNWKSVILQNGDLISAVQREAQFENIVEIKGGGVFAPGIYSFTPKDSSLFGVIEKAGGFTKGVFSSIEIVRKAPQGQQVFNINHDDESLRRFKLWREDIVLTYNQKEFREFTDVLVKGFVRNESEIPYADSITLAVLLQRANGVKYGATPYVYVRNENEKGEITWLKSVLDESLIKKLRIEPNTQVFAYKAKAFNIQAPVTIFYPEKDPIIMEYSNDLNLDVIEHNIGGFSPYIDKDKIEIDLLDLSLDTYFDRRFVEYNARTKLDANLIQPGCVIHFRENPLMNKPAIIRVSGEVVNPGSFTILGSKESVKHLLEMAGGFSARANPFGVRVYREGIDGSIPVPTDNEQDVFSAKMLLNNGDRLHVMRDDRSVKIQGAVLNPGYVPFESEWDWEDYINAGAGGVLDTADMEKVMILYPNGIAKKAEAGCFAFDPEVVSGAVIIVPEKPYVIPVPPEPGMNVAEVMQATMAGITSVLMVMLLYIQVKNDGK